MIIEICMFVMGFTAASFIRQSKVISIAKKQSKELHIAIAEAEEMQAKFNKEGNNNELVEAQIESFKKLERHIGYKEILHKFNYIIW